MAAAPIRRAPRTSISAAIDYSVLLLEGSGVEAARRVIDISGDGANNQGRPVTNARNEALDRGIVINGLPILLKRGGYWDIEHLDLYYRDCVIGGLGAFMVPIRERQQFEDQARSRDFREPPRSSDPARAKRATRQLLRWGDRIRSMDAELSRAPILPPSFNSWCIQHGTKPLQPLTQPSLQRLLCACLRRSVSPDILREGATPRP